MAPVIAQLLVVLMMMPAIYNGIASSLHMEIVPNVLDNRISDNVKIKCVANDSPYWTGDIVFFQLSKKGEHPIAIVGKTKVTHGSSWKANMEAEGNLNEVNITKSFLTLTIKNPEMNDAGLYSCQLFYRDGFGDLKQGQVYGNFTVNNDDDKLVIRHLVKSLKSQEAKVNSMVKTVTDQDKQLQEQTGKVTSLEKTVGDQEKQSKEQDAKVTSLEKTVADQEKQLQEQSKHSKEQDAKVTSLEKTAGDQEKQLQEQSKHSKEQDAKVSAKISELSQKGKINHGLIQNLTDKESFVSAFSAGYDTKDTFTGGKTLVFSESILDVGHDYDTSTGVYTAPRRGLYLFTLVVMTNGNGWQIDINLKANSDTVASLFALDKVYDDQSSVSTVLSLEAGDKVRPVVAVIGGGNIINPDDHYSVFNGCFLQPL